MAREQLIGRFLCKVLLTVVVLSPIVFGSHTPPPTHPPPPPSTTTTDRPTTTTTNPPTTTTNRMTTTTPPPPTTNPPSTTTTTHPPTTTNFAQFRSVSSAIGRGTVISTTPVVSNLECAYRCTRTQDCVSVNVINNSAGIECELFQTTGITMANGLDVTFWRLIE